MGAISYFNYTGWVITIGYRVSAGCLFGVKYEDWTKETLINVAVEKEKKLKLIFFVIISCLVLPSA